MEKKDQISQNPAGEQQEEKLRVEDITQTTIQGGQSLTDEEKNRILQMIHSPGEQKIPKPKTVKPKTRQRKQINKVLKKKILKLVCDSISVAKPVEKSATMVAKNIPVLSEAERIFILGLIRDAGKKMATESKPQTREQEIDYDHMNKQELVEMLEEVVREKDITLIKARVARIKGAFYLLNKEEISNKKQKFLAEGGEEEEFAHVPDPLEKRFDNAFSVYRHNRAKYSEELEKEKQQNLKKKFEILEELKQLIASEETLKKTYDEFKRLQDKWKEVGVVPAGELNNLWQNYHFLVEKFFDKVRINKELRDLDLKKNLELKSELCKKAEALLDEKSILNSFKLLQQYHDEWREIGPVPRDLKDEVWERFKAATDKINQMRREHYKELHEEQEKNFEAKEALCEEAEKLISEEQPSSTVKEWQKATDKFNDLLNRWKNVGRAPKSKNDLIWKRYKTSLDTFYSNKRAFFSTLKESQMENYSKKIKLCELAEDIKGSSEWKKATSELIRLQREWKEIGPVPRKYSDKIWKRFRAACDEFFDRKSAFYKSNHKEEEDNLKKKEELVTTMLAFEAMGDKEENLKALKEFQQQWINIGHVPFHLKDKIYKRYREASEKLIEKMHLSPVELSSRGFINKLEAIRKSPEGKYRLSRERSTLVAKMKKLQEDISLWENNIGFFSNSKQANVLKSEFEEKIEQAKKDFHLLKEKIKLIDREL